MTSSSLLRSSGIVSAARLLLLGLILSGFPAQLWTQAYSTDVFNEENGLPERFFYTITQDENGFLWLGTGSGLYRFDGENFEFYTAEYIGGPAEDFTTCSLLDSKNRTWFGHFEGSLTLLQDMRFNIILDKKVLNSSITGIQEDAEGNIWLASQRNGLLRLDQDLNKTHFKDAFDNIVIVSFALSNTGDMLIGTDEGLKVFKKNANGEPVFSHDVEQVPLTKVQCIASRPHRPGFWLGTEDEGLIEYLPGANMATDVVRQFSPQNGYQINNVKSVYEDESENVWLGTFDGILKYNDFDTSNRMRRMNPVAGADSARKDIIQCIYGDRFGHIWLGTYGTGLLRLSEKVFTNYSLQDGENSIPEVFCSMEDYVGNLWFGTDQGVFMVAGSRARDNGFQYTLKNQIPLPYLRKFTKKDGLTSNTISALYEDENHTIWVGTKRDGLCLISPDYSKVSPVDLKGVSLARAINSVGADSLGNIWVATNDGAFKLKNDSTLESRYYSTRNGLAHNNIYDIFTDSKGQVWFATHTNNITLYDGEGFSPIMVTESGEVPNINCISEDMDGYIWIGTDGNGMYRYDGERFVNFNEEDGMVSNYVYHLTVDKNGDIWSAHRNGISRFIPGTEKFIAYPNKKYHPFEENPLNDAMLDLRGNIWYSSPRGLIRYNWVPARTRMPEPFTFLWAFEIFGKPIHIRDSVQLPYNSYAIKFKFLGLTFLQQSAVQYQFKLIGRAPEWSELSSRNDATFQSIGDGEYTFMVRACNALGTCNEDPVTFTFFVAPPFWKTWWFRFLVILAVAGIIYSFVKYREYRFEKEKAVLEAKVVDRTVELQEEKNKVEMANLELEKLSLVARETDNAVFILDAEGNLEWVNLGFTRLTGLSFEDVQALHSDHNFLETSSNPQIRNLLESAIQSNSSVSYESKLPSKNAGESIWVVSTLTPILDEKGQLRKVVIIDSNITERKLAEQQVREMNSKLEALVAERTQELKIANTQLQKENADHVETAERLRIINQELDNFVYRASHDLKGPLASLMGLVDIARGDLEDNAVAIRYLELMQRAGRRLDNILVDLIEATQVKQGAIQFEKLNVRKMVLEIIESMSNRQDFVKVDFRLDIDPKLEIITDRKLMNSILQNFIDNSVKYRDASKPQSISWINIALQDDNSIDIKVRDNGIGIKDKLKSKVFDMFFRGTSQAGGSGLGLYIVKQAAEKLKGTIDMKSEFQKGTTFMAFIPNRSEAEITSEEDSENPNEGFHYTS